MASTTSVEGLGDDLHAVLEQAVADRRVLGVAGDEEHAQAGAPRARGVGHLPAVELAGQADVGDQQIDPLLRLQHGQRRRTVADRRDPVAEAFELLGDQQADRFLVLDQQHAFAVAAFGRPGRAQAGLALGAAEVARQVRHIVVPTPSSE